MKKSDNDSELAYRMGVRAGRAMFEKSKDDDIYDKLQKHLLDLWAGTGKHLEKCGVASDNGEAEYKMEFEFEYDLTEEDVRDNLPPDLAEAYKKKDLFFVKRTFTNPTTYQLTLKLHWVRDKVYQELRKQHREELKRKREEEEKEVKEEPAVKKEKEVKMEM